MGNILLLEDEESVRRGIAFTLEKNGYTVFKAGTVREAENIFSANEVDLVICDITLPDGSGLDFVRYVRSISGVHIICLTALDSEMDYVMGYEQGADDYMTKPFSLSVLVLKVEAFFRKKSSDNNITVSGDLSFNRQEMKLERNGKLIPLTKTECRLLMMFLDNPRHILSKNQILDRLFDSEGDFVDENTIAVNIRRLREKIEPDIKNPEYIKNVRGLGYIWDKDCRM